MKSEQGRKLDYNFLLVSILCFILAFLTFIYFIVKGNGFLIITNDFNDQQIPFTMGLHNAILDGRLDGFSWDMDLGTSTINSFSFYELGSPFFWISMLAPAKMFPYVVGWIYMLKYMCAGAFSYLYLKGFVKDSKWAVIGGILYALSGYSSVNLIFYHFHDVIAFFPLLLIGLEKVIKKKDYRLFIISVFINCILSYYFIVGEAVFCIVYFLFRYRLDSVRDYFLTIIRCIISGVLGIGMAAVLFVPNIMYIIQNPRASSGFNILGMLHWDFTYSIYILKTLLLPAEAMTSISSCYEQRFYSLGAYLPLIGLTLVFAYIKKHRDWLCGLIYFLIAGCFIPLIGEAFFMYTGSQMRWWFVMVLMEVLASIKVLDNIEEYNVNFGVAINTIFISILYIILEFVQPNGGSMIFSHKKLFVIIVLAISGIIITSQITKKKNSYVVILIGVSIYSVVTSVFIMAVYQKHGVSFEEYKSKYDAAVQIDLPDKQYRLNDTYNLMAMTNHVPGFANQSSTDSNSIRDFEALFDFYDPVSAIPKNQIPGLAELLGGKYYLSYDPVGTCVGIYETSGPTLYLMEKPACPIGFVIDSYITTDELMKLEVDKRGIALLDSAVIDSGSIDYLKGLNENKSENIDIGKTVPEYVEELSAVAVNDFELDDNGFRASTNYKNDSFVYFSVPYDEGWKASIDDDYCNIIQSGGMMLIEVPAGNHMIEFYYSTPGYRAGVIITVMSIAVYVAYLLILFRNNTNN